MLNTIMNTAHDLLLNTVFYLMAICVITGALGRILMEFGVVNMLEKLLRPLMKPLFNLPGVASLGAVLTFISDNPAIIALAQDKKFSRYFKKYQLISLTNFGTAFGMGLLVIVFMVGQGYYVEPFIAVGPQFGWNIGEKSITLENIANLATSEYNIKDSNISLNLGLGVILFDHLQIHGNYNLALGKSADITGTVLSLRKEITELKTNTWQVSLAYIF